MPEPGDKALSSFTYLGNGLYKSTDGGQTWSNIGLQNSGVINKIVIHPANPDIIYVGTMGNIYTQDTNRGLYKTVDGGANWNNILFFGSDAGIGDLIMDENMPDTLFATGRTRIRSNSFSITYGPASKIVRSYNGGTTWDTLSNGLPGGEQCKVSIAMSQSNPQLLYAVYCDTTLNYGGVYRSANGGNSWTLRNANSNTVSFGGFGWYFGEIRINPANDNTLYILGVGLYRSTNGGNSWSLGAPPWYTYDVHADKHDLKFYGSGGNNFLLATDGGIYRTTTGGGQNASNWTNLTNMPITQFYKAGYYPFDTASYFGGAQDNGTQYGSLSGGLNNWIRYYGGDGFKPSFDPTDSNTLYTETQNGNINVTVNQGMNWNSLTSSLTATDRTNWNTPYMLARNNSQHMYVGTYKLYKNTNLPFDLWTAISQDLTDGIDNKQHVISAIDQSAINSQLLYVGTSDANLWVSQNDGSTWTRIDNGMPDRYVSSIKASPNIVGNVFVSYWGYRDNDTNAHIYFSSNNGNTWTSIASNTLPNFAINDIYILPDGTDSSIIIANDGGVYSTVDRGGKWDRVGNNMPIFPVYDLEINTAQNRLIAATFAMSMQTLPLDSAFIQPPKIINVGIHNTARDQINIYPNPSNGIVNVHLNNTSGSIEVVNLLGRTLLYKAIHSNEEQLNISQLAKGTYFIRIHTSEKSWVKKISKN